MVGWSEQTCTLLVKKIVGGLPCVHSFTRVLKPSRLNQNTWAVHRVDARSVSYERGILAFQYRRYVSIVVAGVFV